MSTVDVLIWLAYPAVAAAAAYLWHEKHGRERFRGERWAFAVAAGVITLLAGVFIRGAALWAVPLAVVLPVAARHWRWIMIMTGLRRLRPAQAQAQAAVPVAKRARNAPRPAAPDAGTDGGPPPPPRFAGGGDIPPDHAAAQQRIALFEPEGASEHVHFLLDEAKAFTGYGDAIMAYADSLLHRPGVAPEALKATFELADLFGDVGLSANRAVKQFADYYAGWVDWIESGGEPTRDGRWMGR